MNPTAFFLTATAALCLGVAGCSGAAPADSAPEATATAFSPRQARIYTTAESTDLRLSLTGEFSFAEARQPLENEVSVFVNPGKTFQTILGIGGAITDASAEVFSRLSPELQQQLLEAYFDPEKGIGYTLVRTNIHSCDFSSGSYTYVSDTSKALGSFSIAHDQQHRIPMIKRAMDAAGGNLTLYASPWSPPAFMKSNQDMLKGGSLLPEYYDAWALYFAKFIKAYEQEGLPVWGLTIQNEPMATQRWESCIYTAEQERDFLKNHLGPVLKREGLGDKKIIIWDHNRDLINHRVNTILSDPEAAAYTWGVGFHWYETWAGGEPMFNNLGMVSEAFPDKHLIFTEGCAEGFDPAKYALWSKAERYGRSLIQDFNQGTVAWTDWNILLDGGGGPNHVGNFCFAPVHSPAADSLLFTSTYYYLGHFSKFIRPGAVRVSTAPSRSVLQATSFRNEDGSMATVVMNTTDNPVAYTLYAGNQAVQLSSPAHSIQTICY